MTDDPRLSGTFTGEVTAHFFDETVGVVAGSLRLETTPGRGLVAFAGTPRAKPNQDYLLDLVGDGAYQGCAASLRFVDEDGSGGSMRGVIHPLEALAPAD